MSPAGIEPRDEKFTIQKHSFSPTFHFSPFFVQPVNMYHIMPVFSKSVPAICLLGIFGKPEKLLEEHRLYISIPT